ncbi:MAG: peptide chain release factor N(5)-glutamine methyltransferase [Bacteroidales bacterium]|nr:peptide chain release factor N(5)-glutamine methyltransferase [Bacteroidales bacterium]
MTVKELFDDTISQLTNFYGENEAQSLVYLSFKKIFDYNKFQLYQNSGTLVNKKQLVNFNNISHWLKQYKPIQYIFEETTFYNCNIKVNEHTLIPRPETEELVEWIVESNTEHKPKILDIGTGSGCIAISLKKLISNAIITGLDINKEALKTANENSKLNQVKVNFKVCNILEPTKYLMKEKYDLIVSNPPYVTEHEKLKMQPNVLNWEPHSALFVPDNDPLKFYKVIIPLAWEMLQAGGSLFLEINENLPEEIHQLLLSSHYRNIEIRKDLSGKYRMAKGVKI